MLKQATAAMSSMSSDDMERIMSNTPLPPGIDMDTMKKQMKQMQSNPELLQNALETLQGLPEDERKKMLSKHYESRQSGKAADPEAFSKIFENPDLIQQAVAMTKDMSDDDLKKLNINNVEEADVMRKAAEQMAADPNLVSQMAGMMKSMPPEQLQSMMEMSSQMRNRRGNGAEAAEDPQAAMSSMMSDPDMMKATEEMMKNISPETLASMARASGLDINEDKAKTMVKFLPFLMRLMRWFGYVKKLCSAMFSRRGRIIIAVVVLAAAMAQQMRS